jgi:hypothetical protein
VKKNFPLWAMTRATPADIIAVQQAQKQGYLQIKWPPMNDLRAWAKLQGWRIPRFGFESAFMKAILTTERDFTLALSTSGIELEIPKASYTITVEQLAELDALYDTVQDLGGGGTYRPGWRVLVAELREIRRAVEAGVKVSAPDKTEPLNSFQSFYEWAHGRYYLLEEGYDSWIGDDDS